MLNGSFFKTTINAARYQEIIQSFMANLDVEDRFYWFQQDDATVHTATLTMDFLREFFDVRIILKNLQSLHSPDLSPYVISSYGAM